MDDKFTVLAHNIRFLRKKSKISQEELANELKIKRSNIAAYEAKNVEPRLRIILEIAKFFNVDITTLIHKRLSEDSKIQPFGALRSVKSENVKQNIQLTDSDKFTEFINKSIEIRKILDGFKAFYSFRKEKLKSGDENAQKLIFDIDNFIQLMEHLLSYNKTVIKALSQGNEQKLA